MCKLIWEPPLLASTAHRLQSLLHSLPAHLCLARTAWIKDERQGKHREINDASVTQGKHQQQMDVVCVWQPSGTVSACATLNYGAQPGV